MAILSGCDYLNSINNMGLKTAYRMVRKHKTIEKVLRMLQFDGKFHVPQGYLEAFYQAELTFLHQRVFCPETQTLVMHTEPEQPINEGKMPFIGAYVEPAIAQGVARGDLNPMTKLPIVVGGTRSNMATPTTPWSSSRAHHQRSTSSRDLKGKPIDTFFKPKRIPLGEMNPNCFTPSPSQQEALARNSGPWAAIPVPRPYLNRVAAEPEQLPQSAPPPARISAHRTHTRTPTISEPRPQKRPRLCADIDAVESPIQKVELCRSRFFSSAAPEPSPTVGRNTRSKRSKKQDINIFSDDSVEEAMLSLPDVDGFKNQKSRSSKKIPVFDEGAPNATDTGNQKRSQSQRASIDEEAGSQNSTPSLTTSMSTASSAEQPPTPIEPTPLPTSIGKLKDRFTFPNSGVSTPTSCGNVQGVPTPPSSVSLKPSRIPLAVKSNVPALKASYSTKASLTPLQRLGATARNRSALPMTPPLTPSFPVKPKSPRRSLLRKGGLPFPEVAQEIHMMKNVEPVSVPSLMPDGRENVALIMQSGSEDLIIHDSEGESDALSPGPGDEEYVSTPRLDLGRFAYATQA
jgi:exonuclease-1